MRINVLLIGPYEGKSGKKIRFLAPPLGIHRIASHLRRHGVLVDVFDPNIEHEKKLSRMLLKRFYHIIGFSMLHSTLENDLSLVYVCNKCSPRSVLVAGGMEATFQPTLVLKLSPVKAVVLGEGERPMLNICREYKEGSNPDSWLKSVDGLIIKQDNNFVLTSYNEPLGHTEFEEVTMFMDFDKVPYQKYWAFTERLYEKPSAQEIRAIRIFTTNYCPYKCAFCSSTHFHDESAGTRGTKRSKIVYLAPQKTLALIKRAIKAHPTTETIIFSDDNFTLHRRRVIDICAAIMKSKKSNELPKSLSFICESRVKDVNPDLLEYMTGAGFRLVGYGVESFSDRVLEKFNKGTDFQSNWNAIEWTLNAGITPFLNIILFAPYCNKDDLFVTVDESVKAAERGCEIGIEPYVMPLPGSDIAKENLEIDCRQVKIPKTEVSFLKAERILPMDEEVRKIALDFEKKIPRIERYFARKYGLKHLPSRVRSLIYFYTIYSITRGSRKQMDTIERLLSEKVFEKFS
jgi:radical SAM superfamily enzyme YgiQ (UPF0313 family)